MSFKTANRGLSGSVTRRVLCRLKEDLLDLDPKAAGCAKVVAPLRPIFARLTPGD